MIWIEKHTHLLPSLQRKSDMNEVPSVIAHGPFTIIKTEMITTTHNYPIIVASFVFLEFFSGTETRWTDINPIPWFTHRICTLDADGMR
jgi:hypothetical protein